MERSDPPASPAEALAAARRHARAALAESIAALHALLDALALASAGEPSEANRLLGPIATALESLRAQLADERESAQMLGAIADALDAEIDRWQQRAREDAEARSVLRAFIGVRELLWEFGVRSSGPEPAREPPTARQRRRKAPPARRKSVQRIIVEG